MGFNTVEGSIEGRCFDANLGNKMSGNKGCKCGGFVRTWFWENGIVHKLRQRRLMHVVGGRSVYYGRLQRGERNRSKVNRMRRERQKVYL